MKLLLTLAMATAVLAAPEMNEHDLERDAIIQEVNSKTSMWKAGHNDRFRGQPLSQLKKLCGVKAESLTMVSKLPKYVKKNLTVPAAFDSATNWPECAKVIDDIRDQSMCGCCWAFGAASAASDRLCIASKAQFKLPLSAQETCFCAEMDGCNGGMLDTPWDYISQMGVTTGGQYNSTGPFGAGWCSDFSLPHCHHHGPQGNDPYPAEGSAGCPQQTSPQCPNSCDSGAKAPHNDFHSDRYTFVGQTTNYPDEQSIQEAIMTNGPVEAAFSVYADFANYVSGVYHHVSGQMMGGHAIRIVGWGEDAGTKYWKVANSWNPYWGEKGYFRIVRGTDECGIEDQVTANNDGATWKKM
jgi:cathepsin B